MFSLVVKSIPVCSVSRANKKDCWSQLMCLLKWVLISSLFDTSNFVSDCAVTSQCSQVSIQNITRTLTTTFLLEKVAW